MLPVLLGLCIAGPDEELKAASVSSAQAELPDSEPPFRLRAAAAAQNMQSATHYQIG